VKDIRKPATKKEKKVIFGLAGGCDEDSGRRI